MKILNLVLLFCIDNRGDHSYNTICYGDMSEKCVLVLEIMSYKKFNDTEIPDKILIQILDSKDPNKIYKQATKDGLYEAFRMGEIWLEQALMA